MAIFMVKWAFATIPASIVLAFWAAIPWSLAKWYIEPGQGYGIVFMVCLGVLAIWGVSRFKSWFG
ncbi:MAG TPA: hypothetical protein VHC22_20935 [Pirellulales bacterium]|nr:hypothetical protein [Pirellulales bacterium]